MRIINYYPYTRSRGLSGIGGRSPWNGLENEIGRLFGSALADLAKPREPNFPVDLYEDKDNTYVRAELPGVNRDEISIEMVENVLTIQARRKQKTGDSEESFAFSRSVSLPVEALAEKVSATHEDGVLTVTIPKKEESKPRKVTIAVK